jgi:hypothetical protein
MLYEIFMYETRLSEQFNLLFHDGGSGADTSWQSTVFLVLFDK